MDEIRASDIQVQGGFEVWHRRATAEANRQGLKSATRGMGGGRDEQSTTGGSKTAGAGLSVRTKHMSEHEEQALVIARVEMLAPSIPELRMLFAIPNGGHRYKATAAKLKAEGVKSGVSDLFLSVARHGFHGLYIEMKAQGGRVSDEQKEWISLARDYGYRAEVCIGADAAWNLICEYLGVIS